MAVNAPYGVLVWMFWCYITEACNYINFNQLNQQENQHILEREKTDHVTLLQLLVILSPFRPFLSPPDPDPGYAKLGAGSNCHCTCP